MKKATQLLVLFAWTSFFIAFVVLCLMQGAKERQDARDEYLINSFSPMSKSKEIQDAYKRARKN
jgi:hypothetical protein